MRYQTEVEKTAVTKLDGEKVVVGEREKPHVAQAAHYETVYTEEDFKLIKFSRSQPVSRPSGCFQKGGGGS